MISNRYSTMDTRIYALHTATARREDYDSILIDRLSCEHIDMQRQERVGSLMGQLVRENLKMEG